MSGLKLKNTIGEGTKMFWKYQLAVWLSIQNFYSHFTKVTRKCMCFGRIVEPWWPWGQGQMIWAMLTCIFLRLMCWKYVVITGKG